MSTQRSVFLQLSILVFVVFLLYARSIRGSFVFDDHEFIVSNPSIRNLADTQRIYAYLPSRFLPFLTFALNYRFGALDPFGYHIGNVIIHAANACLVYWMSYMLSRRRFFSFAVSLLFAVHPIQTQAVSYITQRFASMGAMFYLLSVCTYLAGRLRHIAQVPAYFFSLGFAILAYFTKENTYTLPFAVAMTEWFFVTHPRKRIWKVLLHATPFLIAATCAYFFLFGVTIPVTNSPASGVSYPLTLPVSRYQYALTQIDVLRTYVRLLVFPVWQNLDYDYPLAVSLLEFQTAASLALLLLLFALGMFLYQKNRIASYGIFFFFLALSIESSFIPANDVIFEHRLYLPSVGMFLAVVSLSLAIVARFRLSVTTTMPVFAIVIGVFATATYNRNLVWNDDFTMWSDIVVKSPKKARGHFGLGVAYIKRGERNKAEQSFLRTIELNAQYVPAYHNLGFLYTGEGKFAAAQAMYEKARAIDPRNDMTYVSLGGLYYKMGETEKAQRELEHALVLHPENAVALNNLGVLFASEGKKEEAARLYQKALDANPTYQDARENLLRLQRTQ